MMSALDVIVAKIVALINGSPRSPTRDEIGAVIAEHIPVGSNLRRFTHAEFAVYMQARKKHFPDLERYERRPDEVGVILADPLVLFVERYERRLVNGILENPPRTYVIHWNEEMDAMQLVPIDWRAAGTLAPECMKLISSGLQQFRDESGHP